MDTITHALAPLIIAHLSRSRFEKFGRRSLIAIGVAGALPDVLTPHFSLEARMTRWSHGLPFWTAFTVLVFIISILSKKRLSLRLAGWISFAYLFHLICDSISGGINWLYPVRNFVWGDYWVSPLWWIPLDFVCLLICYYLFRMKPHFEKARSRSGAKS